MISAYKYVLLALFCLIQKNSSGQEIKVGQTIPPVTLQYVLNHSSDSINLADLRGKAIILDYWGFSCISCLQSFPKIDSLQKQFRDRLQILLVNRNSMMETSAFFAKRKKIKMPGVPLITNDSILNSFFPHTGVPFLTWIDSTGKVSHLTGGKHLTSPNIKNYLDGQQLTLTSDRINTYHSSFFRNDLERLVKYFSYIARCTEKENFHITGIQGASASVNTYYCVSAKDLYQIAYNESENEGFYKFREPGRTILEMQDQTRFEYPAKANQNDSWMAENGYYYHSLLPDDRKKDRFKFMKEDLQRYFNLDVKIAKRKVRCLALIRTSTKDKLKTKGGMPASSTFVEDLRLADTSCVRYFKNKPFKELFHMIKTKGNWEFNVTIIDRTGYSGNIDFEINDSLIATMTVESLRKELRKYDLDFVEVFVLMDVLLLKEKRGN